MRSVWNGNGIGAAILLLAQLFHCEALTALGGINILNFRIYPFRSEVEELFAAFDSVQAFVLAVSEVMELTGGKETRYV